MCEVNQSSTSFVGGYPEQEKEAGRRCDENNEYVSWKIGLLTRGRHFKIDVCLKGGQII